MHSRRYTHHIAILIAVIASFSLLSVVPAKKAQARDIFHRTTDDIMAEQAIRGPQLAQRKRSIKQFEKDLSQRQDLPSAAGAPAVASYFDPAYTASNASKTGIVPQAPQTVALQFTGATLADTGLLPPDTTGSVGPTQFLVGANGRIRVFDKAGVMGALDADPDVFFSTVMTPDGATPTFTNSPSVRYDPLSQRWIITIIDIPDTQINNRLLIAYSDSATITGSTVWTFSYFEHDLVSPAGDTNTLLFNPTLGVDANALYIGGMMFNSSGSFTGTTGFVVRKAALLSSSGNVQSITTAFRGLVNGGTGSGPFAPQGVNNWDPAATEGYFIGVDNATFSTLMFRRVSNPGSASPTISANISVTVPTTTFPARIPHLGNTGGTNGQLDGQDDRLYQAMIRNGRLWTAHNFRVNTSGVASTAAGNRVAVRWYEFTNLGATPTLVQSGTIFDNTVTNPKQYWIPSVVVSGQGHAAFGFSVAGTTTAAGAATIGRLATDSPGTTQGIPVIYAAGTGNYNPPADPGGASGRVWGGYSSTTLDPCDDMTAWTIQEFNNALNSYGLRVAKLQAPAPTITGGPLGSYVTGQTGLSFNVSDGSGAGFYDTSSFIVDPCRTRLTASITNGVTVTNTVTVAALPTSPSRSAIRPICRSQATGTAMASILSVSTTHRQAYSTCATATAQAHQRTPTPSPSAIRVTSRCRGSGITPCQGMAQASTVHRMASFTCGVH